jgi:hypothetical protein
VGSRIEVLVGRHSESAGCNRYDRFRKGSYEGTVIEIGPDTIGTLVDKLLDIEQRINQESGALVLFALFERDDAPGKWDLVVSAAWAKENQEKDLINRIAIQVRNDLRWEEKVMLSRILILDPQDPFVQAINGMANVDHAKDLRITNFVINGTSIKDSYIITSRRPTV